MAKLIRSIITLLLVISLFTTSTFAWVSLANVNSVKDISLFAASSLNYDLDMSVDGINYYSSSESIPKEVLLNKVSRVYLKDITTNDGINFTRNYNSNDVARKNRDYISIDFHFRTTSRYTEVHLSDNIKDVDYNNLPFEGTYIASKGINFESKHTFLYDENHYIKKGEINKFYGKDAMRVAFHNEEQGICKIFDLTGNEHRGFGKPYGALDYLNKATNLNIEAPKAPNTQYYLSTFSNNNPYALTDYSLLVTLKKSEEVNENNKPYYKGMVTMNVWLEGYDADAFDAIAGDQVKMQFMFRAVFPKLDKE